MDYLGLKEHATIFNEIEGFGFIEDDIVKKNIKNKESNLTKEVKKGTKKEILDSLNSLLKSFDFIKETMQEHVIVDDTDFVFRQHEFLNHGYIIIDIEDNILKVINYEKQVFIIDMSKISKHIYSVIIEAHSPRKILVDNRTIFTSKYLEGLNINSPYDISHIVKMFYKDKFTDLKELLGLFTKEIVEDRNLLLYNLFQIKTSLNDILQSYSLMTLVNKEMDFISVMCKIESIGLPFSKEDYEEFQKSMIEGYESTALALQETYEADFNGKIDNKEEFLDLLIEKELYSANKDFWVSQDEVNLHGFFVAKDLIEKYKDAKFDVSNDRLFIKYDFYNDYGNVKSSFDVDGFYIACKEGKSIVSGTFVDLYFRIFASLTNLEYIVTSINENKFIEEISNRAFKNTSPSACFNATNILKAYIEGFFETNELADYFFVKLDTKFDDTSMANIQSIFNSNTNKIIKFIKKYYRDQSRDKRFCFTEESSLHQYIKMTEADIFKTAVLDVDEAVTAFNDSNKYKIHIVGIQENKIILECDDKALNIAIDILNRKLTKAFDNYVKKVQSVCNVVSSGKLKG